MTREKREKIQEIYEEAVDLAIVEYDCDEINQTLSAIPELLSELSKKDDEIHWLHVRNEELDVARDEWARAYGELLNRTVDAEKINDMLDKRGKALKSENESLKSTIRAMERAIKKYAVCETCAKFKDNILDGDCSLETYYKKCSPRNPLLWEFDGTKFTKGAGSNG